MEIWIPIIILAVLGAVAYFIIKRNKDKDDDNTTVNIPDNITEEVAMGKYALIVGINKYSTPGMDLAGCVNDANSVRDVLIDCFEFEAGNIRMLIDVQATKKNILDGLKWLVALGRPGNELVYYHSGHGSQVYDVSGDEADQLDEILVPHDHDWNDPFLDDYLAAIFRQLPQGAFLSMICDTCHSGSMTKSVVRNIAVPKEMAEKMKGKDLKVRKFGAKKDITKSEQRHILLSGCKDDQYSSEASIGGRKQGAMTYNFLKECRKPSATWADTHKNLVDSLKAQGWSQDPQLSGAGDLQNRVIFGNELGSKCDDNVEAENF